MRMSKNYTYVVIDNEAGMEHLSRRTTRDVQHLLIVTDPHSVASSPPSASQVSARNSIFTSITVYLIFNDITGETVRR